MALPMVPYEDALPLYGLVWPILISVAVTPGSAAKALTDITRTASVTSMPTPLLAMPASSMSADHGRGRVRWNSTARPRVPPAAPGPGDEPAQRARDALRHDVHHTDEEDSVDGPRRRLRDVLGPVG